MIIFNKTISIKKASCNVLSVPGIPIAPSVNLFVKVTNGCNAQCSFCSNASSLRVGNQFNIDKLFEVIHEIKSKDLILNRINITGGEPSIVPALVKDIVQRMISEKIDDVHLHLNTNGLLPESQRLMQLERWDSISISIHHFSIKLLSELYGYQISPSAFYFDGIDKNRINVSCNLIKGYIDSLESIKRMLDFVLDLGIPRIGFVALMKINEFCKDHFIDIDYFNLENIPHVYFIKSMNRGMNCKCSNYLYNRDTKVLEIYMRNYANPLYCESSLVFDGEYLRQGFHDDNIIY